MRKHSIEIRLRILSSTVKIDTHDEVNTFEMDTNNEVKFACEFY